MWNSPAIFPHGDISNASSLIALLRNEPGGEEVYSLLADNEYRCFIHAVNLCEVYFECLRNCDEAQTCLPIFLDCGLLLRDEMDTGF